MMRFLMLVLSDSDADPDEEAPLPIAEWVDEAYGSGRAVTGDPVLPAEEARTIRRRGGTLLVEEGVVARAFTRLEGFDVLECETLEDAIALAARHPMATSGTIQLHPTMPLED